MKIKIILKVVFTQSKLGLTSYQYHIILRIHLAEGDFWTTRVLGMEIVARRISWQSRKHWSAIHWCASAIIDH